MKNNTTQINERNVKISIPFKVAEAPPQIPMNNPKFSKLTAAEKLNDSEYRGLVYRTYPNEPTCGCSRANVQRSSCPTLTNDKHHNDSSVNFLLECPGGCKNSCCSSLRRSPIANNENNGNDDKVAEESIASSFYCIGNQRSNGFYNSCYSLNRRIRGGGGSGPVNVKYQTNADAVEPEWTQQNPWCHTYASYAAASSRFTDHSLEIHGPKYNTLNCNPMPGCWCQGREVVLNEAPATYQADKWSKSHFEIERLSRALEEAQNFVNSLGKVPGMAGLGLMDPTESPYFRDNKQSNSEQSPKIMRQDNNKLMHLQMVNSRGSGICNAHAKSQSSTSACIKATPFTISLPGRGGIVREATLPDERHANELEQLIDVGPCGEINCKSKRRIVANLEASMEKIGGVEESRQVIDEHNSLRKIKYAKYRNRGRRRKAVKKNTRRINYVYFAGETYPQSVYGHKNCNQRHKRVPPNMGWLWTQYQPTGQLKPRVGWRPGTISRRIREMIREGKAGLERSRRRPASVPSTGMRGKNLKTRSHASLKKGHTRKLDEEKEESEPPPTLHIRRKDGTYYITMYPIEQETMDEPKLEIPIKPLQFTIPKRWDDSSDAASSSNISDMDIEFSPPAAVNRYKKKPNVIHVEIQVNQQDFADGSKSVDSIGKVLVKTEKKVKIRKKKKKTNNRK